MAQQGQPYLVPFGSAGMVSHPNRWRAKAGEFLLAENVVVENDLVNKEPAATYYDPNGINRLQTQVTWSASGAPSIAVGVWYKATAAATTPVFTAIAGTVAPGTSWTVGLTAGAPVSALHAVRISVTVPSNAPTAVTDSRGHLYTLAVDFTETTGGATLRGQIWITTITTALQAGDTLPVTLGAGASVNLIASAIAGVALPLSLQSKGQGQYLGTSATVQFLSSYTHSYPVIGVVLIATTSTTVTADFSQAAPFTTNTTVTTGGHQQAALTAPVFWGMGDIVQQIEWHPDTTSSVGGTFTVAQGSRSVTGAGSFAYFLGFRPGDFIILNDETQLVASVQSDTALTTVDPWENAQNATTVTRIAGPILVTACNRVTKTGGSLVMEAPQADANGLHGQLVSIVLTDALARGARGRFVVGGKEHAANPRKLFYLNGVDPIQVMSAETTAVHAITKPAADWATTQDATKQPINGIVHQDSFVVFGNWNDPHRIYFSTPDDHEDFQTSGTAAEPTINFRIASNVGQRLWGAAQFQGVLFLWKYPHGIFYIDDTPDQRLKWTYRIRSMALGCAPSPYAVLATDDDVIFCDSQGHFHLLSAVATLGGTRDSDITRTLGLHTWTDQNVDVASLDGMRSVYDGQTKTAWFGLRSKQAPANDLGSNDLVIRWDFSLVAEGGPLRMTTSRAWAPNSLCLKRRNYVGRQVVLIGEFDDAWLLEPGLYGRRTNYDLVANADVPQE